MFIYFIQYTFMEFAYIFLEANMCIYVCNILSICTCVQQYDQTISRHQPLQLKATEKLSQVYKLQNHTYGEQCRRQIEILKLYYGNHLQLPINDVRCSTEMKILQLKYNNNFLLEVKITIIYCEPFCNYLNDNNLSRQAIRFWCLLMYILGGIARQKLK